MHHRVTRSIKKKKLPIPICTPGWREALLEWLGRSTSHWTVTVIWLPTLASYTLGHPTYSLVMQYLRHALGNLPRGFLLTTPICVVWSWRLKVCYKPAWAVKGDYLGIFIPFLPDDYAMLMKPNKAKTGSMWGTGEVRASSASTSPVFVTTGNSRVVSGFLITEYLDRPFVW